MSIRTVRGEVEPATWDAFWETRVERRSADEVAQELGKSKWAVYQASCRVARRLREELKGFFDEKLGESA